MQLSLSEYLIMGRQSERCRLTIEKGERGTRESGKWKWKNATEMKFKQPIELT